MTLEPRMCDFENWNVSFGEFRSVVRTHMPLTLFLLTAFGMRMHPRLGFGGSYEDHWPRREPLCDPFYRSYHYPRYPYKHPFQPNEFTLSQKTDCIRHELCIPHNVSMSEAILQANVIMGMESKGPLATQIEELMRQLVH